MKMFLTLTMKYHKNAKRKHEIHYLDIGISLKVSNILE